MHAPLASLTFASLAAAALPEGVIELPLQRIKNQSAYGAEFLVGTPPQKAIILADTGSPTYAFESPSSSTLSSSRNLMSCSKIVLLISFRKQKTLYASEDFARNTAPTTTHLLPRPSG